MSVRKMAFGGSPNFVFGALTKRSIRQHVFFSLLGAQP
jgi:hypothetical protein